jgi:hypothetical protein
MLVTVRPCDVRNCAANIAVKLLHVSVCAIKLLSLLYCLTAVILGTKKLTKIKIYEATHFACDDNQQRTVYHYIQYQTCLTE